MPTKDPLLLKVIAAATDIPNAVDCMLPKCLLDTNECDVKVCALIQKNLDKKLDLGNRAQSKFECGTKQIVLRSNKWPTSYTLYIVGCILFVFGIILMIFVSKLSSSWIFIMTWLALSLLLIVVGLGIHGF